MVEQKRSNNLIYESVIEHIRADLLAGRLVPGSQLPTVAALAEQLGVGQAAVREAYRILQSRGILEVTQGRGTFVTDSIVNVDDMLDDFKFIEQPSRVHLLEARRLLEPGIAALAAERATAAEVEQILKLADISRADPPTPEEFQEINIAFHDAIVSAARNPVLKHMLAAVYDLIRTTRPVVNHYMPDAMQRAISSHKLIAAAINERDADAARVLMYQHIRVMEEQLLLATGEKEPSDIPKFDDEP